MKNTLQEKLEVLFTYNSYLCFYDDMGPTFENVLFNI